ncbi:Aldehyde/histidinol dehydrogenase [Phakopsora pachyrhizi]|nr:Aldehyde/histidinol dehydrogenase [Phakopsora pachyrhizi]
MGEPTGPTGFKGLDYTPIDQIETAYRTVANGHSSGITKSFSWRLHQLKQLAYLLQENETLLEDALEIDLGRPRQETRIAELNGATYEVMNAIKNLKHWTKPTSVKTDLMWKVYEPKIFHEPKGVVLIISPWNYPVTLLIGPLVGAIAGGNSLIIKPSENCPATTSLMTRLIESYMDSNNIQVINGDQHQATKLLDLKFDHIFYTGNEIVGKIIASKAAQTLTPVTLELGGKSPVIIFDDADLLITARRILWGKLCNAGQTCIAPDYLLVPRKIEDQCLKMFKKILKEFYPNKSTETEQQGNQYSQIINERQFNRLKNLLNKTKGEVVLVEDLIQKNDSHLKFPITLVKNVKEDDELMKEEIFGPILPIMSYESQDDLVNKLRRTQSAPPLAVYAFSKSKKNLELVRNNMKSGQLVFNELLCQFVVPGLPFGGFETSGTGSYHGHYSFLTFTHERASMNLPFWAEPLMAVRNPPYNLKKSKLAQLVLKPKRLPGKSNPKVPKSDDEVVGSRLFKLPRKYLSVLIVLFLLMKIRKRGTGGGDNYNYEQIVQFHSTQVIF